MAVLVVEVWVRHGHITRPNSVRWPLLLCLACMGLALLSVGPIIAIAAHDLAG